MILGVVMSLVKQICPYFGMLSDVTVASNIYVTSKFNMINF